MAITIIAKPQSFYPAYNQMRYIVDSTNKNNIGFEYVFQVFESGTANEIARYSIKPRFGDGYGVVDLSMLLSSKVTNEMENINTLQHFTAANSFYKYDVKIGEKYVTSYPYTSSLTNNGGRVQVNVTHPFAVGSQIFIEQNDGGVANPTMEGYHTVYAVPSGLAFVVNVNFSTITNAAIDGVVNWAANTEVLTLNLASSLNNYVFNGVFNAVDAEFYDPLIYELNAFNSRALTTLPETGYKIAIQAPLILNFRTKGSTTGAIRFENSDGDIFQRLLPTTGEITAVNCGTLNTPTLTLVSGSFPLIKATTTHYFVYHYDGGQTSLKYKIEVTKGCEITPYSLVFIDQLGSLISLPFTLKAKETMIVKRDSYNQYQDGYVDTGVWKASHEERGLVQVNTSQTKSIELNSPFVSDNLSELYYQLFASPEVMIWDGTYFQPVILEGESVRKMTRLNDRMNRYTVTVKYANNERVNG